MPLMPRRLLLLLWSPPVLACATYYLWWRPKILIGVEPRPLVFMLVLYWISLILVLIAAYSFRHRPRIALTVVIGTGAILFPPTQTAALLTEWWVRGVAP